MLKKILIRIGIALVVIIVGFVVVVALQPSDVRVMRTMDIAAPAEAVFAQVNDFHKWEAWSPWAKIDPACKMTYDGAAAGTGAKFVWAGNNKVGEGRMAIIESHPSDLIRIQLEFIQPMAAIYSDEFTFKPAGKQTTVTWTMAGKQGFMGKAFGLFVNMDKMIGGDFEKGLAQMKTVAEGAAK